MLQKISGKDNAFKTFLLKEVLPLCKPVCTTNLSYTELLQGGPVARRASSSLLFMQVLLIGSGELHWLQKGNN